MARDKGLENIVRTGTNRGVPFQDNISRTVARLTIHFF